MRINKYLPVAYTYFFINTVALPFGLTYTALLAPFLYIWIILVRKKEILLPFLMIVLPFIIFHLALADVAIDVYGLSLINVLLVYVFCQAVYTFLRVCNNIEKIFRRILVINFMLCLVAIPLYFSSLYYLLWDQQVLSSGVGRLRRLRLFSYEPSYYALLFTPFFCFFLLQYLFRQNTIRGFWLLPMLFLPYILSFSLGVIGTLFLAGIIVWIIYFKRLTAKRRVLNALISCSVMFASLLLVLVVFSGSNPVFTRLGNILGGDDSSGKGRTIDAFLLAGKIMRGNEYWGIGLGQIKIAGENIISDYYLYNMDFVATIPNAAAETLAIFGWVGFVLRLLIEIFLFFYTRVWINYYRLLLFCFVFIYQFTGSFVTNIAEYVVWILAFTNVFSQFDAGNAKRVAAVKDGNGS